MPILAIHQDSFKKGRIIIFGLLAAFLALAFMIGELGLPVLVEPRALLLPTSSMYHPALHRWHDALWGTFAGLLLGGSLLALVWQGQKKPLLVQFFALAILIRSITLITMDLSEDFEAITLGFLLVFLLLYPVPRALLSLKPKGRISIPLLALSALALILLLPDIWHNIAL